MKVARDQTHPSVSARAADTTTSFGKLRGFTLEVLDLLSKENLSSQEVSFKTDKTVLYVNVYLYRLLNYGLALKNEDFWYLSQKGIEIHSLLKPLIKHNNNNNTTITQQQHNNNTKTQKKPKQVTLEGFFREKGLSEVEKEVVDMLVAHLNESGGKYLYFRDIYEIAEKVHSNPGEVEATIKKLKQEEICYIIKDPLFGCWKLGLKKAFVETLQKAK